MARRQVRIGSMTGFHQYDDGDFDSAMETDQPIKAGTPVDPTDVLRMIDVPTLADIVSALANIVDHAVVRGDGGSRVVQGSLVAIDDAGNITLPALATVDGVDVSVHVADVNAHHNQSHAIDSHSDANLGAISNNDLMRWNDPTSKWLPKSIAEVILAQNINPGAIKVSLTIYANNAAAVAGGLAAGDFYRNGADPDLVCVVH